jgi:hypothetical protein
MLNGSTAYRPEGDGPGDVPPVGVAVIAPVAVPAALPDRPLPDERTASRWRVLLSTPACFGYWIVMMVGAATLSDAGAPPWLVQPLLVGGMTWLGVSILLAAWRVLRGFVRLVTGRDDDSIVSFAAVLGNLVMTGFGLLVAYVSTVGFSRGRQLRRFGRVQLPDLRPGPDWTTAGVPRDGHEDPPRGLAEQWRDNGRTEHASVAAFARLTLDLMALGAPPALIAAANRDSLDEIRHAELCFSLARALDGRDVGPAPFPRAQRVATLPRLRTLALAKLAVDSLVDGALHEGVSARIIARLARLCEVPGIRGVLKEIAADEGRHAAHGWAVVEWCLHVGGRPVADALLGALRGLPAQMQSELPAGAADGGWVRWGIHGHDLEAREYAAGLAHVAQRVRSLVARAGREAA